MADDSNKQLANAQFRKAQQAADGKKAMAEYESGAAAVRLKTERLRALRLAKEAADAAAVPLAAPPKKSAKKKAKAAAAPLADWLDDQKETGRDS